VNGEFVHVFAILAVAMKCYNLKLRNCTKEATGPAREKERNRKKGRQIEKDREQDT